mmetsp:Transcript_43235/g.100924  ORF Transcript_43235/g.100924 Transcript_43235/m.100924 type:complete len:202 (-) Transcript_43235:843-1448(-)
MDGLVRGHRGFSHGFRHAHILSRCTDDQRGGVREVQLSGASRSGGGSGGGIRAVARPPPNRHRRPPSIGSGCLPSASAGHRPAEAYTRCCVHAAVWPERWPEPWRGKRLFSARAQEREAGTFCGQRHGSAGQRAQTLWRGLAGGDHRRQRQRLCEDQPFGRDLAMEGDRGLCWQDALWQQWQELRRPGPRSHAAPRPLGPQ